MKHRIQKLLQRFSGAFHQIEDVNPYPLNLPGREPDSINGEEILQIEFPPPGHFRARKVVSRSNARGTGKYPGFKTGRMLQYESLHERNAMVLLDACPGVVTFSEQPCLIRYGKYGFMRLHYPDLLVVTANGGKEFWEIKEAADAAKPEVVTRTATLTRLLLKQGYQYRLIVAESLKKGPQLLNARLLLRLGRTPVSALQRERIRRLFGLHSSLPWIALARDEYGQDMRPCICRLILEGVLSFDVTRPLTDSTSIRWVFDQRLEGEQSWQSLALYKAH